MAIDKQSSPVPTKEESKTISEPSWKLTLNGLLVTLASVYRKQLLPEEILLWEKSLGRLKNPEGIKWAFEEYVQTAKYFPIPADIIELYGRWIQTQKDQEKEKLRLAEKAETERRIASGEKPLGLADFYKAVGGDLKNLMEFDPSKGKKPA